MSTTKKNDPKKQIRDLRHTVKSLERYYDQQCERANNYSDSAYLWKAISVFVFMIGMVIVIVVDGNYLNSYYNPTIDEICRQNFGSGYITHNQRFGPDDSIYCQYNESLIPKPYIPAIRSLGGQNDERQ